MDTLALDLGCMQPYPIIYADPPWCYRGRKQFGFAGDVGVDTGGAINQYPTMSLGEICALPAPAENSALLFLWTTGPMFADAMMVIASWGFTYATVAFVWDKMATNPGYYTLSQAEFCLVAKRGTIPQPRGTRNERQWIECTEVIHEKRGEHSQKPAEVRDRISRMFPEQRKLEMFARERVEGWDAWGAEV